MDLVHCTTELLNSNGTSTPLVAIELVGHKADGTVVVADGTATALATRVLGLKIPSLDLVIIG